ncbi:MAG: hypothetical protein ACJAUW_000009 [Yoonia sp.]|jgi:hypothetical protein
MSEITFETLRAELDGLRVPAGEARNLRWLAKALAIARNASGDYEIFIRGPELHAASSLVRRHLQHGEWRPQEGGASFFASRVVLPSAPHFGSVSALISVELLRAGLVSEGDAQGAFSAVEPIIEIAIRRGALPENVVVGLIGELIVLRQCLISLGKKTHLQGDLLECWCGWQVGGRDFLFGESAIEVKTTQAASSSHEFSGLHQLEEVQLPNGAHEQLHLLSIGLQASTVAGESLSVLVDQLLGMLRERDKSPAGPLQTTLLSHIEHYGSSNGVGYRHATMKDWSVYQTRYTHSFSPRLYRVADPSMRLLRREEVSLTYVVPSSLSFTLHFPDSVSAFNPAPSWQAELSHFVQRLG